MAIMSGSNRPHVLGLVIITAATSGPSRAVNASRSTRPRALDGVDRLQRMDVGEARQARDLLVEPGIVLHRARAEREQAEVDRIILPAEPGIMAHRLRLRQAGKADRAVAFEAGQSILPGK